MTLEDTLHELVGRLGPGADNTVAWEQYREWPHDAIAVFRQSGWIQPAEAASTVECPGCEANCFMPVIVREAIGDGGARAYVNCDRRDDMGRIKVAMDRLQQWQITAMRVARWIAGQLELRSKPKTGQVHGAISIGSLRGHKQRRRLELVVDGPASLRVSSHCLPLTEAIVLENGQPELDRNAIMDLVDRPIRHASNGGHPSTSQREASKRTTQARYASWREAYRKLRQKHRNMSDVWCARQIAKTDIAQGRSADTIRKQLKK